MERRIAGFVDGATAPLAKIVASTVGNGIAFVIFASVWLGFGLALVASQGSLDAAWHWVRALPLFVQGFVWLLFLPVVVALWIWETAWPLIVRLIVIGGLAWWSLRVFLPRWLMGRRLHVLR